MEAGRESRVRGEVAVVSAILRNLSAGSRLRDRRYDDSPQLFESHLARILVSFSQAASHHLATFTLKVTVLAPPAFLMTNLYCPSFVGVTLTEHFGPGESSLAPSSQEDSQSKRCMSVFFRPSVVASNSFPAVKDRR